MLRRDARLRKEYLYRKGLEAQEAKMHARTQEIGNVLKGTSEHDTISYSLRKDAVALAKRALYDEGLDGMSKIYLFSKPLGPRTSIDDEYGGAGERDPKILITTSRDPSGRLQQFAKELRLIIPNSQRINRGNSILEDLVKASRQNEVTDLILLHEHRGIPDTMIVCHFPYGPTTYFSLSNVLLRHDVQEQGDAASDSVTAASKPVSEVYPQLIFSGFTSKVGERVKSVLKYLFPVPKPDSKRVISFVNQNDYISFRHHMVVKGSSKPVRSAEEVEIDEVGPRFDLRPYQIKLGTVEAAEADTEWSLRPYMNTAKKRKML